MIPRVYVDTLQTSGGSELRLGPNDIVVVVGPNNAGKSRFLAGALSVANPTSDKQIVRAGTIRRVGEHQDLMAWLMALAGGRPSTEYNAVNTPWGKFDLGTSAANWTFSGEELDHLARLFRHSLGTVERITGSDPAASFVAHLHPPETPIQHLYRSDRLSAKANALFRSAFNQDLIVHRRAGKQIPLYIGKEPRCGPGEDRTSDRYIGDIEKQAELRHQGDGMRSFTTIVLNMLVGPWSMIAIDEPEAFLHPPQVRVLARAMAAQAQSPIDDTPCDRQLFIATHSSDLVRGLIDAAPQRVRVVRLTRKDDKNYAHELKSEDLKAWWSRPLVRFSNLLDALFHDLAVICEADSDCRFYSAVAGAIAKDRDVLFSHCGGKDRLHEAATALKAIGVPVRVVADIDILNDESKLKRLVESLGGSWASIGSDWKVVHSAVEQLGRAQRPLKDIRKDIDDILGHGDGQYVSGAQRKKIEEVIRSSSPWATIKQGGTAAIPSGSASKAIKTLLASCEGFGLFVVPVGEVERFVKDIAHHGPEWVVKALDRELSTDADLEESRIFVKRLLAS